MVVVLFSLGLPSSHSSVVSGIDGSHIVVIKSTKGTPAMHALKASGARLTAFADQQPAGALPRRTCRH